MVVAKGSYSPPPPPHAPALAQEDLPSPPHLACAAGRPAPRAPCGRRKGGEGGSWEWGVALLFAGEAFDFDGGLGLDWKMMTVRVWV
jgi:hypothetical protein